MRKRYIVTVQASHRAAANSALEAKGFGPNNFSVPLVPTTQGNREPPATHYSCNWQFASEGEQARVAVILSGISSLQWDELSDIDPATAVPTFANAIAARGRARMIVPDPQ